MGSGDKAERYLQAKPIYTIQMNGNSGFHFKDFYPAINETKRDKDVTFGSADSNNIGNAVINGTWSLKSDNVMVFSFSFDRDGKSGNGTVTRTVSGDQMVQEFSVGNISSS